MSIMVMMKRWMSRKQVNLNLDDCIKCSCSDKVRWERKNREVSVIAVTTPQAIWIWDIIIILYPHPDPSVS